MVWSNWNDSSELKSEKYVIQKESKKITKRRVSRRKSEPKEIIEEERMEWESTLGTNGQQEIEQVGHLLEGEKVEILSAVEKVVENGSIVDESALVSKLNESFMFRREVVEEGQALLETVTVTERQERFSLPSPMRSELENDPLSILHGGLMDNSLQMENVVKLEESLGSRADRCSRNGRFRRGFLRETFGRKPDQTLLLTELEDWRPPRGTSLTSQLPELNDLNSSNLFLDTLVLQNGDNSFNGNSLKREPVSLDDNCEVNKKTR